ncbi:hypothetical protein YC2023_091902 [Brassica napus]
MPARVFLLSGSSETRVSAEEFGFLKETCDRYGEHGPVLHSKCIDCFKTLPLASDFADNVVYRREVGENDDGNITLNHVLWSCPWMADGLSESNYKGLLWGADCTESFLKQSNLKGPDAKSDREEMGNMLCGYSVDHGVESGELYTIFSASHLSQVTSLKQREILKSLALQDFMFSEWFESCRFRLDGVLLPADQSNVCSSDGIILLMNCAHNMVLP